MYDDNEELITRAGPWDCSTGEGIIYGVKQGTNRTTLIYLKNGNNTVVLSGRKSGITVIAGQITDAGVIDLLESEEDNDENDDNDQTNHLPIASNDHATVNRGGFVTVLDSNVTSVLSSNLTSVLNNDTDPDNHTLTVSTTPVIGPANGSLTLNPDGTFSYTHNNSDTTLDSFTYRISDGHSGTAIATVIITVNPDPKNCDPVLTEASVSPTGGDTTTPFTYTVHYSDSDGNAPAFVQIKIDDNEEQKYSMSLVSGTASNGFYRYQTRLSNGNHTYSFSCSDGHGGGSILTTSAGNSFSGPTVTSPPPPPPPCPVIVTAVNDFARVNRGGVVSSLSLPAGALSLITNDSASDGSSLSVSTKPVRDPEHGTLLLNDDGTFSYRHDNSETTADSFVYRVLGTPCGSDEATVSIAIGQPDPDPRNHDPILTLGSVLPKNGTAATTFTYSVHYFDEDEDPGSVKVYIDGVPHDMTHNSGSPSNGDYQYQAALMEGFRHTYYFAATDGHGGLAYLPGPEDEPLAGPVVTPVCNDSTTIYAIDDSATVHGLGGVVCSLNGGKLSLLANDASADESLLRINTEAVRKPSHGSVVLREDGTFSYKHDGSPDTRDSFVYGVYNRSGCWNTATVNIMVDHPDPNHDPILTSGTMSDAEGNTSTVFTYSVHYSDPDGDLPSSIEVTIDGVSHMMNSSTGLTSNGIYQYQTALPEGDGHTYSFAATDGHGGLGNLPDPDGEPYQGPVVYPLPDAVDDSITVVKGETTNLLSSGHAGVLWNDSGHGLTVVSVESAPSYGRLTLNEDGTFSYTHDGSDSPSDSFTYSIEDEFGASNTAMVTITIVHRPVLTGGTVSPDMGDTAQDFTYSVYYFDEDGNEPLSGNVIIDGLYHPMALHTGSASNGYYQFTTRLPAGEHSYAFSFTNNSGLTVLHPSEETRSGPKVYEAISKYYVAPEGDDENDGLLPANPFATINHALEVAEGTSTVPAVIYIAAGTYYENISMDSFESLQGGWNADFSLRSDFRSAGMDSGILYETIITGTVSSDRCITISSVEEVSIDGLTIRGEDGSEEAVTGGGIAVLNCSPTIRYCRVENHKTNASGTGGAGIYVFSGNPRILNCLFSDNVAEGGYAMGGGIYNEASSPVITGCLFIGNSAAGRCSGKGGAICHQSGRLTVTNCTFTDNSATSPSGLGSGGAIYKEHSVLLGIPCSMAIINSILWGNDASYAAYKEIFSDEPESEVTYSDIEQTGFDAFGHNISQDPRFLDPGDGDFRLKAILDKDSPCINAASNTAEILLESDLYGHDRIIDGSMDMGAYEWGR